MKFLREKANLRKLSGAKSWVYGFSFIRNYDSQTTDNSKTAQKRWRKARRPKTKFMQFVWSGPAG